MSCKKRIAALEKALAGKDGSFFVMMEDGSEVQTTAENIIDWLHEERQIKGIRGGDCGDGKLLELFNGLLESEERNEFKGNS